MFARTTCRVCAAPMRDVLSLGNIVPVDFIKPGETVREALPLTLAQCRGCGLVQLRHQFDVDSLFRQYWYRSAVNPTMVAALKDVVTSVMARVLLEANDVVVDIGANDGTLLDLYDESLFKVGVDPALNLAGAASGACDQFINDYFESPAHKIPKAKVITSIAMFYDLNTPRIFVQKIVETLRPDGIWVMQMTDLVRMLQATAVDNICHEHVCYYSLAVFRDLVADHGLEVFDVEFNDVNGASVRCYIANHGAYPVRPSVAQALAEEADYLGDNAILQFSQRVERSKRAIVRFVRSQIAAGKTIHALGASTKGNTLLQYFGLGRAEIPLAAEVSHQKFGLVMAGSDVPIVSQEESLAQHPDYYLVLPWHFIDFLVGKHQEYLISGGAMIAPLPAPVKYTVTPLHPSGYAIVKDELAPDV